MVRGSDWRRLIEDYIFFLIIQNNILASTLILLLSLSPHSIEIAFIVFARTNQSSRMRETKQKSCTIFVQCERKKYGRFVVLLAVLVCRVYVWEWNDGAAWLMESINQTVRARCLLPLFYERAHTSLWAQTFSVLCSVALGAVSFFVLTKFL